MKQLLTLIVAGSVAAMLLAPAVAQAVEPQRPLTVRLEQEYVKKLKVRVGMYSQNVSDYEDGVIDRVQLSWSKSDSFTKARSKTYSLSAIERAGNFDADDRELFVTLKGLASTQGYYVRARFLNTADDEASEWKESSVMTTLPKKAWNLRVPKSKKVAGESVRLRWNHPKRCLAAGCDYNVKVYKVKKSGKQRLQLSKLVLNKNYLDLTDSSLKEGQRYTFKVNSCLSSSTCAPKYTKKKKFRF